MTSVIKIVVALATVVALTAVGFFVGVNSVQPELRASQNQADDLSEDLRIARDSLADAEEELSTSERELDEAQATLAACDAEQATEVFEDLLAAHGSVLQQYRRYLNNDELIFLLNFDAFDSNEYTGANSMIDQFTEALEACTGSGANA